MLSLKTKRRSSRREKKTRAPPPPPFLRPAKRAQRSTSALERLFGIARARGIGRSGARGRRGERDFETRFLFCVCAFFLLHDEINWAARHPLWNTFVIPRSLPNTETPKRVGCCALRRARGKREKERESRRDGEERGAAFRRLVVDALYSFSYVVGKNLLFPIIERKSRIRDPSLSCGIKRL